MDNLYKKSLLGGHGKARRTVRKTRPKYQVDERNAKNELSGMTDTLGQKNQKNRAGFSLLN